MGTPASPDPAELARKVAALEAEVAALQRAIDAPRWYIPFWPVKARLARLRRRQVALSAELAALHATLSGMA